MTNKSIALQIFIGGIMVGIGLSAMAPLIYSLIKEEIIDILSKAKDRRK